jgi:predicted transcriptional regulator
MREIVQSIKPKWIDLIFKRLKTKELRKSKPAHIEYPFKVYMYETKPGAGAIVGEYICNGIVTSNLALMVGLGSCVSAEDIQKYMGNGKLCGWNITNVARYDTPKPLSAFGLLRAPQSWCYVN